MSAASHGAGSGVVLGIVFVLLAQQLAYLDLTNLVPSLEYLFVAAIIGGILGAIIGGALGRRYARMHPAPVSGDGA